MARSLARRGDASAMSLDEVLDDRESEPETTLGTIAVAFALDEHVEHVFGVTPA